MDHHPMKLRMSSSGSMLQTAILPSSSCMLPHNTHVNKAMTNSLIHELASSGVLVNTSYFPPTLRICFCPIPIQTMEFNPQEKQWRLFKFKLQFFSVVPFLCIHLSSSAVLAPILQDPSTRLQFLSLYLRTPYQQPTKLLVDLTAPFSWVECTCSNRSSCTYRYHPLPCASPLCNWLNSPACSNCSSEPTDPICSDGLCHLFFARPRNRKRVRVQALADSLALPVTNGRNPGQLEVVPEFVFSCSERSLLKGHVPRGVTGLAALGQSKFSLPAQVSNSLSSPNVFALCPSDSPSAPGVAFFGTRGPYFFLPEIDLSKHLNYTPLLISTDEDEAYLIGLTSIRVNGRVAVKLNRSVLTVDENGFGGTTLSLSTPYTVLESSIYASLVEAFVNESAAAAFKLTATQPVSPFSVCYDAGDVLVTSAGPAVPTIDLVMQSNDVVWRILGSNSMVRMAREGVDVWCLALLDGGANPPATIVIGGQQMVDNLLQFDLDSQQLGFSSSVLVHDTMCANFNFTVNT
ncbi:probable aspartic proteinase GIP1 [Coffea arabica]|uniref:Probable aspartic proteinase GIP1 n=1 Tax=Coffea arabica TaxID=13443 RepID=A0ABM4W7A2_COFAR